MSCSQCKSAEPVTGQVLCAQCLENRKADSLAEFESLCPPLYRTIEPQLTPRASLTDKILNDWQTDSPNAFGYEKPGLIFQGRSGSGKTLTAWQLLRRLMVNDGASAAAFRATQWARQVVTKARTGELDPWVTHQCGVEYLFLDDLDKPKFTLKIAETLYDIIDERATRRLPILITLNASSQRLCELIGPDHGPAIVRRLSENCELMKF